MISIDELIEKSEAIMSKDVERIFETIPYSGHLTDEDCLIDEDYYIRHRVETIKRINMTAKTDALALYYMISENYHVARLWAHYTAEELSHDILFMKDLEKHGYTREMVDQAPAFSSSVNMINYIENQIKQVGSIAAVAYSVFVEFNSDKAASVIATKLEDQFSREHAKGIRAHIKIDEKEDHYALMLKIVHGLINNGNCTADEFYSILSDIANHVADYFKELYEYSQTAKESTLA